MTSKLIDMEDCTDQGKTTNFKALQIQAKAKEMMGLKDASLKDLAIAKAIFPDNEAVVTQIYNIENGSPPPTPMPKVSK